MTIQEKIACTHNASTSEIHLWKEGVFWVAYEQSAYAVWLLKKYRPTRKFIKSAGMEVVCIGFPQSAWGVVVGALRATSLQTTIHISEFPAGVYLLQIETLQGMAVKKIIKK